MVWQLGMTSLKSYSVPEILHDMFIAKNSMLSYGLLFTLEKNNLW